MLSATSIEKTLGDRTVIDDVDLTVDAGEVTVVMGPNGAGKTVLLCCLAGALRATAGSVTIRERPLVDARSDLNLLLQDSMLLDRLTGRENARFYTTLHPRSGGRWRDHVQTLGLDGDVDRPVREYSGGMRRKLEIAIALDADVPVYLLDEPTAGLDLSTIQAFHDLVLTEADRGKAVLLASHVPLDMEIAGRVLFLDGGTVTESGAPGALLRTLPTVVRIRGDVGRLRRDVADCFLGGRMFERGDEVRGFLTGEASVERVRRIARKGPGEVRVEADPPSYADLFDYLANATGVEEREGPR